MKKIFYVLLILPFCVHAQNTEILPQQTFTNKLLVDSIKIKSTDSLGIMPFRASGARINNLKTSALISNTVVGRTITSFGLVTGNSGGFVNFSASGSTTLNNATFNNATALNLTIPNQNFANPLFTTPGGTITKTSPMQYLSLPAAAFFPE